MHVKISERLTATRNANGSVMVSSDGGTHCYFRAAEAARLAEFVLLPVQAAATPPYHWLGAAAE